MRTWVVFWDNTQNEQSESYRARDIEHAIRMWKRDHSKVSVRAITRVLS